MIKNRILILISTMNNELPLFLKKNNGNSLVVNQTKSTDFIHESLNSNWFNFNEKGLSKSRNRAISLAVSEYCCISDNDVFYVDDYEKIITDSFELIQDADVLVFQIKTIDGDSYKKYNDKIFKMNKFDIMKVSSIEIVFKNEKIKKNKIKFDENFGLGAIYSSGEENIFLADCLKNGLKIYSVNIPIVYHPLESSGKLIDDDFFYNRGAVFFRIYGIIFSILLFVFFSFKKTQNKKLFLRNFLLMLKGAYNYQRLSK